MNQHSFWLLLLPVAAYFVGAIPFGLFVGWLRGVDIRQKGSGNIGATNVGRVLGRKWGLLVFGLDVTKGAVPTAVAAVLVHHSGAGSWPPVLQTLLVMAVQAGCVFGHVWPIYLGFKGGKGVATSLGILLGYWPYLTLPGLAGLATWGLLLLATRYVSAASIIASCALPIYIVILSVWQGWPLWTVVMLTAFTATMATLIVIRHRSNITRLLAGTEPKMGQKGPHAESGESSSARAA